MFRRIYGSGGGEVDPSRWPATVPAVAQILASGLELPGARIPELGSWGIRPAQWDELELVANWRQFLSQPQSFLRHL
jgi:predicted ATPase